MTTDRFDPGSADIASLQGTRPYFDNKALPNPANVFVAWIDVMGAANAMKRSHEIAANYVMKLHAAVLAKPTPPGVALFPIIDGAYIVSSVEKPLFDVLCEAMFGLGLTFIFEQNQYRFTARAAVAYGPVIMGPELHGSNHNLKAQPSYCNRIVLGMPLTQAYIAEREASPFGVYIHESARAFAPSPTGALRQVFWRWWLHDRRRGELQTTASCLKRRLEEYYIWCEEHNMEIMYDVERIKAHRELSRQYFAPVP